MIMFGKDVWMKNAPTFNYPSILKIPNGSPKVQKASPSFPEIKPRHSPSYGRLQPPPYFPRVCVKV